MDQDFNGGQIAEQALDYMAEDKQGNVWSLGSYTESYEGGQFVNATDAWLAGVSGATPGILMLADPQPGTPEYTRVGDPGRRDLHLPRWRRPGSRNAFPSSATRTSW